MRRKTGRPAESTLGLVLEGITEYRAIPLLLHQLGVRAVAPSVFNGQPVDATVPALVEYRLLQHVRTQLLKASGKVIIVLDREDRSQSAEEFGTALREELVRQIGSYDGQGAAHRVAVAVADRRFENWLLADPEGVSRSKLLRRGNDLASRVKCHADTRNAKDLLQSVMAKRWYERAVHGPQLALHLRVEQAGVRYCSPSFAAFLRLVKTLSTA